MEYEQRASVEPPRPLPMAQNIDELPYIELLAIPDRVVAEPLAGVEADDEGEMMTMKARRNQKAKQ
eukprot:12884542-Prorocentrum_lima.AAC.1